MDISIALPGSIPGADAGLLVDWARTADRAGFTSLAALDRLVYDSFEPLTALAAAAAVTERIRLMTAVLLSPLHTNTALLAKQAATVHRLSGERLTLGLAVGARPDDYQVSDVPMRGRGARLERQVAELQRLWAGEGEHQALGTGPAPGRPGGPGLVLGGHTPAAMDRAARLADGWIAGGAGPDLFGMASRGFTARWQQHERAGRPRLYSLCYFALGDNAQAEAEGYLRTYYRNAGPFAQIALGAAAFGLEQARERAKQFADQGCDELIFVPCAARTDQVAGLAELLG
ncbi:LLM class flavin-dependent oxidoreductase [Kitasatospora viridis]|uniref:Alkanesulfonate monooxygenase SsuD/methylene tetrahydromethanopterin reductase-like flavin-dependent oxidoreductase (Luciferase family) n=1 Tax=Kitasatospora viridis TaxID=281105 RepID=A0A561UCI3_9ACTN|nr:LLM class flavin-dependent oxidoreductase [Kitasatospora viridis]TWF97072.1 alkanesulfonate monooxygenase SsuD/methylene tetrahydromethanopterin reductase-like flavin-dependent oxidoreductase (luciferase family) [Kitasatospora viridis]